MAEASSLASMIGKNYLECSICTGPFDDPRVLPCLHNFCCGCLENWAKACSKNGKIVSCPLCKKVYQVPEEEGIKGFPAHFLVADLQSTVDEAKQNNSVSDLCENHGEKKIYYCENCDCAACSDCSALDSTHRGHSFVRLKQAASQQSRSLVNLTGRVRDVESKYTTAVQQVQQVKQNLDQAADAKIKAIMEARKEILQEVDKLVKIYEQQVYRKKEEKATTADLISEKLQSELDKITSSCELAANVTESGSDSDIISLYPSLSATLQQLAQSQPSRVDVTLSQIQLEPTKHSPEGLSSLEQLLCDKLHITPPSSQPSQVTQARSSLLTKPSPPAAAAKPFPKLASARSQPTMSGRKTKSRQDLALSTSGSEVSCNVLPSSQPAPSIQPMKIWKESGKINTTPKARYPYGIAIHPNGDFAVTSVSAPVTLFSRNGDFKHVIKSSHSGIFDIAITPSNQYIIPSKRDSNEFHIYDSQGVLLRTIPTYDINNKPTTPFSVAVDSTGRIIVGLGYAGNKTVSIHQPGGTLISKFETKSPPVTLTCTPDDRLIISFGDKTLQVMDQSGHNATLIQPPPGIQSWHPWDVCCSKQGELFVSNSYGDLKGVYRYVDACGEYKYLDCIARGWQPWGIALSADEEKLFVVDYFNNIVKIFE